MSRRKKIVLEKICDSLEKMKNYLGKWKKYLVLIVGIILLGLAGWFWLSYGLFGFIPPVTSITIIIGVVTMWCLVRFDDIIKNIFGTNKDDARKLLLEVLGTIFMGFVLMITILWGLMGRGLDLYPSIVYFQSFLLVLLFFFFVGSFYCILDDL